MGEEQDVETRVAQVRAVFRDGAEADNLAQAEAMVGLGSGVDDDGDGRPQGMQVVLVSGSGCTNYWNPGPEHGGEDGVGAYASLVPGVEDAWFGGLRAAAVALVDHDLRVAAGTGHVTCAVRTYPDDFEMGEPDCPCGNEPIVGAARP
jgi:hypothetical protein